MIRLAPRLLLVAIVAYLLIALLQALFLEALLGGRVAPEAALSIQLAGVAGTVISGIAGGYLAAWLGGRRPWLHAAAVLAPLLADTLFVIAKDTGGDPLWYHLGGSTTLMAATLVGCWLRTRGRRGAERAQATSA